jgi:hypothetical protein
MTLEGAVLSHLFPDVRTRRGQQNKDYAAIAINALLAGAVVVPAKFQWMVGSGRNYRQAVLVELGRIAASYGSETALHIADQLGAARQNGELGNTREAAAWLRRRRLRAEKRERAPSAEALSKRLWTTVLEYLGEHPEVDDRLVTDAISLLIGNVEHLPWA